MPNSNSFSQKTITFHGQRLPEPAYLVGYAWIISYLEKEGGVQVPLPDRLAAATEKHQRYTKGNWEIFTARHRPNDKLADQLVFALKYEGLDLYILKKLFTHEGPEFIEEIVRESPTGQYARRIWFLYEWLFDQKLQLEDLKQGSYVDLINPKHQYPGQSVNAKRQRIRNNLPGTPDFCPLIRKTETLEAFIATSLDQQIEAGLESTSQDLLRRTAAFLLLKDSKASFQIEGENPGNQRIKNWGKIIGQAGKVQLDIEEIERLQQLLFGNQPLKNMGIRQEEGFIGEHDRETMIPIPDHISAKAKDLSNLLDGLFSANKQLQESSYHPVFIATTIAFGFVFIHPLTDGNGRLHRYIIHHILAKTGFARRGLIFPVAAAILNRIDEYQEILEAYSSSRVSLVEWEPTIDNNVNIKNDTADLYRYFDLTRQAAFLFDCVRETIEKIIPSELDYLEKYNQLFQQLNALVSLPDNRVDLLIKLLDQNNGKLSKKKREKEFSEISNEELKQIESWYASIFSTDE
ncbi:MAG: cell filamentation protein Fic [Bacteroidetes bacterium]|nr:cell filamentation protein Fic [Bacteroidota bacterium]